MNSRRRETSRAIPTNERLALRLIGLRHVQRHAVLLVGFIFDAEVRADVIHLFLKVFNTLAHLATNFRQFPDAENEHDDRQDDQELTGTEVPDEEDKIGHSVFSQEFAGLYPARRGYYSRNVLLLWRFELFKI